MLLGAPSGARSGFVSMLSARHCQLGPLDDRLWIVSELRQQLFHLLMRGRIDVEISPLRLGQEFLVAHRVLKCLAQDHQAFGSDARWAGQGTAQQLGVEVEFEHLAVVFGFEKLEYARDRTKL